MKSWTGFTGEEDRKIRKNGKCYLIAYINSINSPEEYRILKNEKELETFEWEDWCYVCALSKEDALKNYENAFLQWRDSIDKGDVI